MIELHGWLTIQDTYKDVCGSDDLNKWKFQKKESENEVK